MKTKLVILCLFLLTLFANSGFSAEGKQSELKYGNWSFFLEGGFGARIGVYDEIVWTQRNYDGERYKQSELKYNLLPSFYTSLAFSVNYKRLGFQLSNKLFFAYKAGTLTDSDWRNDSFCKNGDTSTKTDYSEHTLFLANKFKGISGFDIDLKGHFNFYPTFWLTLAPLLSFNAQYMNFMAKDGTGYYGSYDQIANRIYSASDPLRRTVHSFEGERVIEYEVYNLFIWTGLKAKFSPLYWLNFELASELAPCSILIDFDRHLTNNKNFKEVAFSLFYAFRQTLRTEFKIEKNFSICQTCVFTFTGESEGQMYLKNNEYSDYKKIGNGNGGGQVILLDFELSAKISW
ncbi:MAG: hypothetical protein K6A42_03275 [Treponema sp.]|nr:hypothetical protein [Treponema sp.]